jgi:hypothetical protein
MQLQGPKHFWMRCSLLFFPVFVERQVITRLLLLLIHSSRVVRSCFPSLLFPSTSSSCFQIRPQTDIAQ